MRVPTRVALCYLPSQIIIINIVPLFLFLIFSDFDKAITPASIFSIIYTLLRDLRAWENTDKIRIIRILYFTSYKVETFQNGNVAKI